MTIDRSLWQGIIMFLAAFNLIASLLLLFCPDLLTKMNNMMSKWFSTNRFDEAINRQRNIDQSIIGSRKFFGIISFLFSLILVYIYIKL